MELLEASRVSVRIDVSWHRDLLSSPTALHAPACNPARPACHAACTHLPLPRNSSTVPRPPTRAPDYGGGKSSSAARRTSVVRSQTWRRGRYFRLVKFRESEKWEWLRSLVNERELENPGV